MHIKLVSVTEENQGEQFDENNHFLQNNTKCCFFSCLINERVFEPSEYFQPKEIKPAYDQPSSKLLVWLNEIKTILESIKENVENPANKRQCSKLREKELSEIKSQTDNQHIHKRKKNHLKDYSEEIDNGLKIHLNDNSPEICNGWKNVVNVGEDDIACNVCYAKFKQNSTFLNHFKDHYPESTDPVQLNQFLKKPVCAVKYSHSHPFEESSTYTIQLAEEHKNEDEKLYQSMEDIGNQKCEESVETSGLESTDISNNTQLEQQPESTSEIVNQTYACRFCKIEPRCYNRRMALNQHLKQKHSFSFICSFCSTPFNNFINLLKHMEMKHETLYKKQNMCDICGYVAPRNSILKSHMETHTFNMFPCDVCGAKLKHKASLFRHYNKIHYDAASYPLKRNKLLEKSRSAVNKFSPEEDDVSNNPVTEIPETVFSEFLRGSSSQSSRSNDVNSRGPNDADDQIVQGGNAILYNILSKDPTYEHNESNAVQTNGGLVQNANTGGNDVDMGQSDDCMIMKVEVEPGPNLGSYKSDNNNEEEDVIGNVIALNPGSFTDFGIQNVDTTLNKESEIMKEGEMFIVPDMESDED